MRNIVLGGGVIGLSIAFELSSRGQNVVLIEQNKFGRKASWAGAGILMPANRQTAIHPMEHLESIGHDAHRQWSKKLLQQTGIDNGFRQCGGLYIARTDGESASLTGLLLEWKERRIEFQQLDFAEFSNRFEHLAASTTDNASFKAVWVPGESQFTNPFHIKALIAACERLGVEMVEECGPASVNVSQSRVESVSIAGSSADSFTGDNFFFAAGPWTEELVKPLGVPLPMQPVRGQIAMYKIDTDHLPNDKLANGPIINEGSRYLVPRTDGHILAGATIEEAGFDCQTTPSEVAGLRNWAQSVTPQLNETTFVKSWAGLRPGTYDGFPYLGRFESFENALVATGHFKTGLQLSTATAIVLADLVEGKDPAVDLKPLSPSRASDHQSNEIK